MLILKHSCKGKSGQIYELKKFNSINLTEEFPWKNLNEPNICQGDTWILQQTWPPGKRNAVSKPVCLFHCKKAMEEKTETVLAVWVPSQRVFSWLDVGISQN